MKHYVEIGGGDVLTLWDKLNPDDILEVFEPHPNNISRLKSDYGSRIILHPYAIWKENGLIKLHNAGSTSFVEGIHSPAICNNDHQSEDFIEVEARTFDQFDDGTIDFLSLDIEGAEWFALEKMISRPDFIFIEMQHAHYRNPFYDEIVNWMNHFGYSLKETSGANFLYQKALNTP